MLRLSIKQHTQRSLYLLQKSSFASNYLNECIIFDIKLDNKLCSFVVLYRFSSQSSDEFESFSNNLELTLDCVIQNTACIMVFIGDFNAGINLIKQPLK